MNSSGVRSKVIRVERDHVGHYANIENDPVQNNKLVGKQTIYGRPPWLSGSVYAYCPAARVRVLNTISTL